MHPAGYQSHYPGYCPAGAAAGTGCLAGRPKRHRQDPALPDALGIAKTQRGKHYHPRTEADGNREWEDRDVAGTAGAGGRYGRYLPELLSVWVADGAAVAVA